MNSTELRNTNWIDLSPKEMAIEVLAIEADMEGDRAMDYDPDRNRFRKYDQEFKGPVGKVVATFEVKDVWQCKCFHWNGDLVPRCNNCGQPKPSEKTEDAAA